MMTDPIADMLTRIRNATKIERPYVDMPSSKLKIAIANVLQREGYIWEHQVLETSPAPTLRIVLKYGPNGERVIQHISRNSKPGRRVYAAADEMPRVLQGLGITVVSTNRGVLSNREAKTQGVGGEVLATIW